MFSGIYKNGYLLIEVLTQWDMEASAGSLFLVFFLIF